MTLKRTFHAALSAPSISCEKYTFCAALCFLLELFSNSVIAERDKHKKNSRQLWMKEEKQKREREPISPTPTVRTMLVTGTRTESILIVLRLMMRTYSMILREGV
jgi:hypothetical protein